MLVFKLVCTCLCFHHSVWDALTDNYICTWDGGDSEGLNGNLSDHEVYVMHHHYLPIPKLIIPLQFFL